VPRRLDGGGVGEAAGFAVSRVASILQATEEAGCDELALIASQEVLFTPTVAATVERVG
jgi:pyridoxal/pyridoxine/pyridoxamine kinase